MVPIYQPSCLYKINVTLRLQVVDQAADKMYINWFICTYYFFSDWKLDILKTFNVIDWERYKLDETYPLMPTLGPDMMVVSAKSK